MPVLTDSQALGSCTLVCWWMWKRQFRAPDDSQMTCSLSCLASSDLLHTHLALTRMRLDFYYYYYYYYC